MTPTTKVRVGYVVVIGALGLVVLAHPILAAVMPVTDQTWVQVIHHPSAGCPSDASGAEAFGRQLDTLTSFYETLIGVLIALLAIAVGFAFWTINFVSRQRAEAIAKSAVAEVIASREFESKVRTAADDAVADIQGDLLALAEDLEGSYEKLNKIVQEKENGNRQAKKPTKPSRKQSGRT